MRWSKDYDPGDIYVLSPYLRLRNDGDRVIAIMTKDEITQVEVMNPLDGIVLSTFDGKRTCADIVDLCTAFGKAHGNPQEDAQKYFKIFLALYTKPWGRQRYPMLVKPQDVSADDARRIRRYDPENFVVPVDKWNSGRQGIYRLAFPVSLFWLLTNDCQVDCQYCYMDKQPIRKADFLPWERIVELAREASEKGVACISISGGDVMCYPKIYDFLDLLDEYGFAPIGFATKTFVSPETASRLAEKRNLEYIQFSIDSTVPEIGDYLVRSQGFVERTLESIDNVISAGLRVEVKSVITPYSLPTIPKLYTELRRRGVSAVRLATYVRSAYRHNDKLFNHPEDYDWLDEQMKKVKEEFPEDTIEYQNGRPSLEAMSMEERCYFWDQKVRCTSGREFLAICANGKVIACEQTPQREADFIGDLNVQSIEEVWNGSRMDEYLIHPPQENFKGTICYDCPEDEFHECHVILGTCVKQAVHKYGTRWGPVPFCPKAPEVLREV